MTTIATAKDAVTMTIGRAASGPDIRSGCGGRRSSAGLLLDISIRHGLSIPRVVISSCLRQSDATIILAAIWRPPMKLFYSPTSPYVRKVMVTAMEKGLEARSRRSTPACRRSRPTRTSPRKTR